jgi:hypothetical protein
VNEERTGKCLRQVEHIRGHLWHRYSITVNQVIMVATVTFSKWWLQLYQKKPLTCVAPNGQCIAISGLWHCVAMHIFDTIYSPLIFLVTFKGSTHRPFSIPQMKHRFKLQNLICETKIVSNIGNWQDMSRFSSV